MVKKLERDSSGVYIWHKEAVKYLLDNYLTESMRSIAYRLGVPHPTIARELARLGISGELRGQNRQKIALFTVSDDAYIVENWHKKTTKAIAKALSKNFRAVEHRARVTLKLRRTKQHIRYINSTAEAMPDSFIAHQLSFGKRNLTKEDFLKHPQLIELSRMQKMLKRKLSL